MLFGRSFAMLAYGVSHFMVTHTPFLLTIARAVCFSVSFPPFLGALDARVHVSVCISSCPSLNCFWYFVYCFSSRGYSADGKSIAATRSSLQLRLRVGGFVQHACCLLLFLLLLLLLLVHFVYACDPPSYPYSTWSTHLTTPCIIQWL